MGKENISHLKNLVSESRNISTANKSTLLVPVTYALEECTLIDLKKPNLICTNKKCEAIYEN